MTMKSKLQNSPGNDSCFGILLSSQDLDRYRFLEQFYQKSQSQTKQLLKKVFLLSSKTIQLQEKLQQKTNEFSDKFIEKNKQLKATKQEIKKQKQLLDSKIIVLNQLLTQKDSQITGLTSKVQTLSNQILNHEHQIKTLQQQMKIHQLNQANRIKSLEEELIKKSLLQEENLYFRELSKELNQKLIEINNLLCQIKNSAKNYSQNQKECQLENDKANTNDIYQSIIMESNSEISIILDNLAQLQKNIQNILMSDRFAVNSRNQKRYDQQLEIIEAENASLRKRVSRLQHQIESEINLGVIRRKFRSIMGTENFQNNKEKIAQKWYELTQEYVRCINEEYDKAVSGLFKEDDHYDEVMEQVNNLAKFDFSQFT